MTAALQSYQGEKDQTAAGSDTEGPWWRCWFCGQLVKLVTT